MVDANIWNSIVNLLAQTLHPTSQRQGILSIACNRRLIISYHIAEEQLRNLELSTPQFALFLLSIAEGDLAVLEVHVRLAAALLFKNFVHRHWSLESLFPSFTEEDRLRIKDRLVEMLTRVPPSIQRQLCEAITEIATLDFPEAWPDLIPRLIQRLDIHKEEPSLMSFDNNLAILQTWHRLFKRYRSARRSDELYTEINYVMSQISQPLLEMYRVMAAAWDKVKSFPDNSGADSSFLSRNDLFTIQEKVIQIQILLNKIFYSLSSQDLPAFFEDHLAEFMGLLKQQLLFQFTASETTLSKSNPDSVDDKAGPREELPTTIINIAILYATRYEEDFGQLAEFVEAAWTVLTSISRAPKYDALAAACMRLLSSVAKQERHKNLFTPVLTLLCDKVIIPNVLIRECDLELFEDEPLDFVRTVIDNTSGGGGGGGGSMVGTLEEEGRRGGAIGLVRGLMEFHEAEMTQILQRYIDDFLALYNRAPLQQWRDKNAAVALFGAIAIKGSITSLKGVTRVNPLVNIDDFFTKHVLMDLQPINPALHPILKIDAIRFVADFRSQLTRQQLLGVLPLLQHHLQSTHTVVHSTAAITLDRILTVKVQGESLIRGSDLAPLVDSFLNSLLRCLNSSGKSSKLIENEVVMRAMVRVIVVAGPEMLISILEGHLTRLVEITSIVALNPANPQFNHNLFEALALLARAGVAHTLTQNKVEERLIPSLQGLLQGGAADFIHYVFQVWAAVIENWKGELVGRSDHLTLSSPLGPLLNQPALWTVAENIPAMTRFLQAMLRKNSSLFVANSLENITHLLGIFQTLVQSSKVHDIHGMALVNTLVQCLPWSMVERYLGGIVMVLMKRLQVTKSPRLALQMLIFLSILAIIWPSHPTAGLMRLFDGLQPKLLALVMKSLLLPTACRIRDRHDRKIVSVGLCKIALSEAELLASNNAEDESLFTAMVGTLLVYISNSNGSGPSTVASGEGSQWGEGSEEIGEDDENSIAILSGSGSSFWKLHFTPPPRICPMVDQLPDTHLIFINSLVALSKSLPTGRVMGALSRGLDPTQQSILATLLQQANVSL